MNKSDWVIVHHGKDNHEMIVNKNTVQSIRQRDDRCTIEFSGSSDFIAPNESYEEVKKKFGLNTLNE